MMPSAVHSAIQAIADRHGGRITPELVVDAARSKDSPLHACFIWDVKKAAQQHWLDQARTLIRSVKIEITTTEFSVRAPAFVRDPSVGREQGYASIGRLRTDDDLAREAVLYEFARASAALARAKAVASALGIEVELEDVRGRVERLTERAQQAVA